MKLISKYNKTIGSDQIQADPNAISEIFVQELNDILQKTDCGEHCGSVFCEIKKFETSKGFINIFLMNEQFMDRVHVIIKKKNVTYKEGGVRNGKIVKE